ncbi:lariat debranching enzyme [Culicoides brevitarsis]|uniref:lariat debranching enzyme n=1 Tax=Culicoides brevitarsis TaxID=469753 RepID=UPI00307B2956
MKIAVEGCAHGELEKIYDVIAELEQQQNVKVDLLICCGDFQSTRNLDDLDCMAVPPKHRDICTFYKYYNGEKRAPMLTLFIGGNHEASNYLQELPYGGWVAPNIYYMGYAGVVNVNGVRIAGISGIYKAHDYFRGHFEAAPYNDSTLRSVYHQRQLEVFRLSQLTPKIDVCISHDWPLGVTKYGNVGQLIRFKPFFRDEIENNTLGSPPCEELLHKLRPKYWFSAHLHCKFSAVVPHDEEGSETKFLALDKCLPKRRFLQLLDIEEPENAEKGFFYDLEWLTVLSQTNSLLSVQRTPNYMPGPNGNERFDFRPTEDEMKIVRDKFPDLRIPENFQKISPAYNPNDNRRHGTMPEAQVNMQTTTFCDKLGIDDPLSLVLLLSGKELNYSTSNMSHEETPASTLDDTGNVSGNFSPPPASDLPKPVWMMEDRSGDPDKIDLDDDDEDEAALAEAFTAKYSTPFKSVLGLSSETKPASTPNRMKMTLPSPKFESCLGTNAESVEKKMPESVEEEATPVKKFKRRNQEIYATPSDE